MKNNKLLQTLTMWTALLIVVLSLFWLCWQGFMVSYLGFETLDLPELLSLFGLVVFGLAAIGVLVEIVRERN